MPSGSIPNIEQCDIRDAIFCVNSTKGISMTDKVTADMLMAFTRAATLNVAPNNSSIPMTPERRKAYRKIQNQVAAIKRSGRIVEMYE